MWIPYTYIYIIRGIYIIFMYLYDGVAITANRNIQLISLGLLFSLHFLAKAAAATEVQGRGSSDIGSRG